MYTLHCTEMEKQIQFGAFCCQKYELYERTLEIKVVEHLIPYIKSQWAPISIPPRVELGYNAILRLWPILSRVYTWMRMRHAKTEPLFNVDALPRWGKQHSAVWRTVECYLSTAGTSKRIRIQYIYVGFIRCLGKCRTVYECTIHSAFR